MIWPLALEILAVETCLAATSCMNFVYVMVLALFVLIVPTASRMATIPMARTPQSQRQLCPPLGAPGWGGPPPSPFWGAFGRFAGLSARCGLTPAMLGADFA